MAHGRADTPASDRLLAATLLALDGDGDGDGYRSRVDAAVSAGVYALIADLPKTERLVRPEPDARSEAAVRPCSIPAWLSAAFTRKQRRDRTSRSGGSTSGRTVSCVRPRPMPTPAGVSS